jgi:hypothetical protein
MLTERRTILNVSDFLKFIFFEEKKRLFQTATARETRIKHSG